MNKSFDGLISSHQSPKECGVVEPEVQKPQRKKLKTAIWLLGFMVFLVIPALLLVKTGVTFSVVYDRIDSFLGITPGTLPQANPREQNRLDVLVLGIRGEGDPHGGLLTDGLMFVSVNTETKEIAVASIPRDLWITIPIVNKKAKINEAYALGESQQRGGGLFLAKQAAEVVTGVNIDYTVSVDFNAFKEFIDLSGGIDVRVEKPLRENLQWGGIDFIIPQGIQHMDGETALFYVRSRFTTSDFDRSRRQQEVLLAMKERALALGFLANPAKIAAVLDMLGRHVRTDISFKDVIRLFPLAKDISERSIKREVLDSQSGIIYSAHVEGAYVLLPKSGDYTQLHEFYRGLVSF